MKYNFGVIYQDKAGDDGGTGGSGGDGGDDGTGGSDGGGEFTQEAFKALQVDNAAMKEANDGMQAKMNVLLHETKTAKTAAKEAAENALQEAKTKAKTNGNYEELYKSSEEARVTLQEELTGLKGQVSDGKRKSIANTLAADLADGENVKLLSTFILPRLKFSDGEMKVVDSKGQLTVSTVEDLKNEFKNNNSFKSLLRGNQASGGDAPGGNKGGDTKGKVITRAEFDKLDPIKKMEHSKSGGKIVD